MRTSSAVAVAALAAGASAAGRPSGTSICDYYTKALLNDTSAEHQATVLTLLVNTVVIGNYTKPTLPGITFPDVSVPGILQPGMVGDTKVNLLPYFDGGLASSNRGGDTGVAVNFLDDGGATPLMMNKPANGTSSNQYRLLTHLYQFFGTLLGCSSQMAGGAFSTYQGQKSQYQVHRFMDLSSAEFTYFIEQVGLAAKSFGVADEDISDVAMALNSTFGYKCAPAATVIPAQGAALQAMCIGDGCPLSPNATESSCPYSAPFEPAVANASLAMGEGNSSATASPAPTGTSAMGSMSSGASATGSGAANSATGTTIPSSGASQMVGSVAAGIFAVFAFLF